MRPADWVSPGAAGAEEEVVAATIMKEPSASIAIRGEVPAGAGPAGAVPGPAVRVVVQVARRLGCCLITRSLPAAAHASWEASVVPAARAVWEVRADSVAHREAVGATVSLTAVWEVRVAPGATAAREVPEAAVRVGPHLRSMRPLRSRSTIWAMSRWWQARAGRAAVREVAS